MKHDYPSTTRSIHDLIKLAHAIHDDIQTLPYIATPLKNQAKQLILMITHTMEQQREDDITNLFSTVIIPQLDRLASAINHHKHFGLSQLHPSALWSSTRATSRNTNHIESKPRVSPTTLAASKTEQTKTDDIDAMIEQLYALVGRVDVLQG